MKKKFPQISPVSIDLSKNIPIGSGLGGGSSNCASVMLGLSRLFSLNINLTLLKEIASKLGSDISFFFDGGTQLGQGFGGDLKKISLPKINYILILLPDINISTSWAFNNLKNSLYEESIKSKFSDIHRLKFKWKSMQKFFENDFESIVFRTYPRIGDLKKKLLQNGASYASLSGSGSTVFGIFDDFKTVLNAERKINQIKTHLVKPIKHKKIFEY
tara:strand:+ start:17126 stop:17773 length:648 start_codon:yes stop_codon:yes gene_type:complete